MLKTCWDELKEFRPIMSCNCGGIKVWMDYQDREYVLQFLMGLNESFSQIHAQILMSEALPSISKVFSLVIQEEGQSSIGLDVSTLNRESTVMYASSSKNSTVSRDHPTVSRENSGYKGKPYNNRERRERPECTHCGEKGHTVDRCYKLHGFPPGY